MLVKIYIQLLDEGTEVYRPTFGELLEDSIYRVLPTDNYDPEDEIWEFKPGAVVRCIQENRYGDLLLVAREEIIR